MLSGFRFFGLWGWLVNLSLGVWGLCQWSLVEPVPQRFWEQALEFPTIPRFPEKHMKSDRRFWNVTLWLSKLGVSQELSICLWTLKSSELRKQPLPLWALMPPWVKLNHFSFILTWSCERAAAVAHGQARHRRTTRFSSALLPVAIMLHYNTVGLSLCHQTPEIRTKNNSLLTEKVHHKHKKQRMKLEISFWLNWSVLKSSFGCFWAGASTQSARNASFIYENTEWKETLENEF